MKLAVLGLTPKSAMRRGMRLRGCGDVVCLTCYFGGWHGVDRIVHFDVPRFAILALDKDGRIACFERLTSISGLSGRPLAF